MRRRAPRTSAVWPAAKKISFTFSRRGSCSPWTCATFSISGPRVEKFAMPALDSRRVPERLRETRSTTASHNETLRNRIDHVVLQLAPQRGPPDGERLRRLALPSAARMQHPHDVAALHLLERAEIVRSL